MGDPRDKFAAPQGEGFFISQISSPRFVHRKNSRGREKLLRFTLSWVLTWQGLKIGETIEGCLAYRWVDKDTGNLDLVWSPPKTRNGAHYLQHIFVSPDWYELVKRRIIASGYAQHLGPSTDFLGPQDPKDVDPSLPPTIDVEVTERALL